MKRKITFGHIQFVWTWIQQEKKDFIKNHLCLYKLEVAFADTPTLQQYCSHYKQMYLSDLPNENKGMIKKYKSNKFAQ